MPQADDSTPRPSVNRLAATLVEALVADAAALRIGVSRSAAVRAPRNRAGSRPAAALPRSASAGWAASFLPPPMPGP
jgi:hypothetical protein